MQKTILLSQYPLVEQDIAWLSKEIDRDVVVFAMSNMTKKGYFHIIRALRGIDANEICIPALSQEHHEVLPMLRVACWFSATQAKYVLSEDGERENITGRQFASDVFKLVRSFAFGSWKTGRTLIWLPFVQEAKRPQLQKPHLGRILFIRSNLWYGVRAGGAVSHAVGVIKGFCRRGVEVDHISVSRLPQLAATEGFAELSIDDQLTYMLPREFAQCANSWRVVDTVMRSRDKYDAIYERLSPCGLSGVALARHLNLPLIIEYNGSESWMAKNWGRSFILAGLVRWIENLSLRSASLIVTISSALKDELIIRGIEPNRILCLTNAVSAEIFNPSNFTHEQLLATRQKIGFEEHDFVVTFVGTFGSWHGSIVFAEALLAAMENNSKLEGKAKMKGLFIGNGPLLLDTKRVFEGTKFESQVRFLGMLDQDEVPEYMALSDVLAAPSLLNDDGSKFFGSPTKLFEYMASARAIIASDHGQVSELFAASPNVEALPTIDDEAPSSMVCVRTRPGDKSSLLSAIEFLYDNPLWRKSVGENARKKAVKDFSWSGHVEQICEHLLGQQASAKKRVLINAIHSRSGGGITYLLNVLPRLTVRSDLDVHIILHKNQKAVYEDVLDGITVHAATFNNSFIEMMLFEQIKVPFMARRIGADLVYSPANYGPLLCSNNVILLRNALSVALVERRIGKLLYWLALYSGTVLSTLRAKGIISVSEYSSRSATGGFTSLVVKDVNVIPHGVSTEFKPALFEVRNSHEIFAVSDLYVQKNLHNLISAFAEISKSSPSLSLTIAGAPIDTDYASKLKQMVKQLRLEEKIQFLGSIGRAELIKRYQTCMVFVFPSTVETFGNPLVEAMACGAPVASSNTAAMPEIAGDAAYYFNPNDIDEIVRALRDMIEDEDLRRELSEKAQVQSKQYSWDKNVEKLCEVFNTLSA